MLSHVVYVALLPIYANNISEQPLRLRLRIGYTHPSAGQVMDQVNWTEPS